MSDTSLKIDVPGQGEVSAVLTSAEAMRWLFVYAPGAGSNVNDPFALHLGKVLPQQGIGVLRFQFLYQERKRGGPDRPALLEATWRAALARARELAAGARLAAGGRSMGGRIASQVVAAGEAVDALGLFAYPLHPPGKPDQRRDEHLPQVRVPTLFCSGTRDAFGSPEELAQAAGLIPGSRVHLLEGADHGFAVPKSSGRTRADVWEAAAAALVELLAGV